MDANTLLTQPKISVITATFNAASCLPALIESLQNQTDKDFEWIIADGGSTDETLALLEGINDLNIKITSQPDFGIYDALNRGIKISSGDYYVVIGADDWFFSNAIHDFRQAISEGIDIITANIKQDNKIISPLNKKPWLFGMQSYISNHAVATLFSKKLHTTFGYYSNKFPIAADNLFVLTAMKGHSTTLKQIPSVLGEFTLAGLSNTDILGTLVENFRVQIKVGSNKYLQITLLFLRLLKHITRF